MWGVVVPVSESPTWHAARYGHSETVRRRRSCSRCSFGLVECHQERGVLFVVIPSPSFCCWLSIGSAAVPGPGVELFKRMRAFRLRTN